MFTRKWRLNLQQPRLWSNGVERHQSLHDGTPLHIRAPLACLETFEERR
jgi:hypothetical protein